MQFQVSLKTYFRLLSYNYLLKEFYILYCDAKEDFDLTKFEEIKQRLQKWTDIYSKSGSFNSEKLMNFYFVLFFNLTFFNVIIFNK